jgi:hypothetical protein
MSGFARSRHELICENVANGQQQTHAVQQNAGSSWLSAVRQNAAIFLVSFGVT